MASKYDLYEWEYYSQGIWHTLQRKLMTKKQAKDYFEDYKVEFRPTKRKPTPTEIGLFYHRKENGYL